MTQNYKLKIAYDGTRYYGWEHQPDQETIQGKIEMVLARMCNLEMTQRDFMAPDSPIKVIGAGRTDAGVHARAMIANVVLDTELSEEEIRDYMNRYLPDDIAIQDVRKCAERFHARYKAAGKTYQYTIFDGAVKPVFNRKYYTALDEELDIDAMVEAANLLKGEHDFKSFCGNPKMKKSTVRIVDRTTNSEILNSMRTLRAASPSALSETASPVDLITGVYHGTILSSLISKATSSTSQRRPGLQEMFSSRRIRSPLQMSM